MIRKIKNYFLSFFTYKSEKQLELFSKNNPNNNETPEKLLNDLLIAISNRDYEKAHEALKKGAPVNPGNNSFLKTPLSLAVDLLQEDYWNKESEHKHKFFRDNIVQLLLDYKADVNFMQDDALFKATCNGNLTTITQLVKHGANIYARGEEILFLASHAHFKDIVYFLLIDLNMSLTEKSKNHLLTEKHHYALELLEKRDFHKKMITKYAESKDLKLKVNKI